MNFSRLLFAVLAAPVILGAAQEPILDLSFDANELRTSQSTRRPALTLSNNVFSVAYWVKPLDLPSHNCASPWENVNYRLVASNGSGYHDGFRTGLVWGGGCYRPFFGVGGAERRDGVDAVISVPPDAWAHVVWTWDGAEIVGYVNGERACALPCTLPLTPPKDALVFGAAGYGMPPLPMRLRSFTCWDRALSQDDVDELTAGHFPVHEAKRLTEKGRWAEARALYAKLGDWQPPAPAPTYAQVPPRRPAASPPQTATTLEATSWGEALARVRELKRSGAKGGVTVLFRGGEHPMTETVKMDAADSGSDDFPIVYAAYPGEEPVFTGGVALPAFEKVSDPETLRRLPTDAARANVRVCDLPACGRLSPLSPMGWGFQQEPIPDFYVDGRWMQPARHPNAGFLHATNIVDKVNCVFRPDAAAGDLAAWAREPDLMGCGYWVWCWADFTVPLRTDPAAGTFTLTPKLNWPMAASWNPDLNYFLVNALHALDREGEYYLDARARRLYAWLPPEARTCTLSMFPDVFLLLNNVHHVQFRGLTFRYGRGRAVMASGCSDLVFASNRILDFGGQGFTFSGRDTLIWGNTFRGFGCAALDVAGGDRRTLAASGIRLENNDISQTSRAVRTYTPGLRLHGCGTQVVYNHFHEILSSAMRLEGNDFLVSMNLVENVVKESGDQGGVDIYNNPSYQGNVYSYNIWRNVGCRGHGQAGIRFDDRISGQIVYGNRFDDASDAKFFGGVQMNGGRRNLIDNNVFTRCAIGVSAGGWEGPRWTDSFTNEQGRAQLERDVNIYAPPYTTRYPGIETLVGETVMTNTFTRNVFVGRGVFLKSHGGRNALHRNWRFEKLPDLDELARETCFDPLPPESDIGTYGPLAPGRAWILNNGPDARRAVVEGGVGVVRKGLHRFVATGTDVTLRLPMGKSDAFAAGELPIFAMRYRIKSPQPIGGLFFTTDTLTNLCDRSFTPFPVVGDGTWRTVLCDMRKSAEWKGTVTSFRLDPVNPSEFGSEIEVSRLGFFPNDAAAGRFLAAADDRPRETPAAAVSAGCLPRLDRTRFQIGAYCLNPPSVRTDETIRDIKACGIDFIVGVSASDLQTLDRFARHGVGVFANGHFPGWWGGNGERAGQMKDINPLSTYRLCARLWPDHPAILAGDIGDEPSALDFPHYGAAVREIRAVNPNIPLYLNLYPNYASVAENTGSQTLNQLGTPTYREHIAEYCRHVPLDYISYDFYPYMNTDKANDVFRLKMYDNFQIVADACRATKRDFWYIPQVNSRYEDRHMTENTLRFQAYAAMAFGAVSITWACYTPGWWKNNVIQPDGTKNVEYARLKTVNAELRRLAPDFMRHRSVATHFVGFPATEKLDSVGIAVKDELACGPFARVRATDGAALLVGEMVSRSNDGARALFVLAADDMYDAHPARHEIAFRAEGDVVVHSGTGEVPVRTNAEGDRLVPLASNAAVLIELRPRP